MFAAHPAGKPRDGRASPRPLLILCTVRRDLPGRGRRYWIRRRLGFVFKTHTVMILPQVHLRKPCYDFYSL